MGPKTDCSRIQQYLRENQFHRSGSDPARQKTNLDSVSVQKPTGNVRSRMSKTHFGKLSTRLIGVPLLLSALMPTAASAESVNAAVLPSSRSATVGSPVTVFATMIASGGTAIGCSINPVTAIPVDFSYQTTDASNDPTGSPNTPVDISGVQNFVLSVTPTSSFSPTTVELEFDCDNTDPAPLFPGVNDVLLSASDSPTPDVIALSATPGGQGIVSVSGLGGSAAMSVATFNIGASDSGMTVSADDGAEDLPLVLSMCETDPASGDCINPTSPTTDPISTSVSTGGTNAYSVFATPVDSIQSDPANHRIYVRFVDSGGDVRGSTSVAINANDGVLMTWDAPTTNVDGSQLVDLQTYKIYWGPSSGNYTDSVVTDNVDTEFEINLEGGAHFFAVTAINSQGQESAYSNEVFVTL